MSGRLIGVGVLSCLCAFASQQTVDGQPPRGRARTPANTGSARVDPELVQLQKDFITKAERLASDYEKKRDFARARQFYESVVRLAPEYEAAKAGLKRTIDAQSVQNRKIVEVSANKDWQDTKVDIQKGAPVRIEAKGSWFVVNEAGPDGAKIPDPKNGKIKLGMLIGLIASQPDISKLKPFPIGSKTEFMAEESGRLILRMFDGNPSDNQGKITVLIQSTFED